VDKPSIPSQRREKKKRKKEKSDLTPENEERPRSNIKHPLLEIWT
jgi:hypothetical protein